MGFMDKREGTTLRCLDCNKTLVIMLPDFFVLSKVGKNEPYETTVEYKQSWKDYYAS